MIPIGSLISIPINTIYYGPSMPLMSYALTNVEMTGIFVDAFTPNAPYDPYCRYNLAIVLLDEGLFFVYAEDLVCT